jgi:hypothetical protein
MSVHRFLPVLLLASLPARADQPTKWLQATAHAIPKETTSEGSGYFAIVPGLDGKLYIGTAKYGSNAYLVEFDPRTEKMKGVVDVHKELGYQASGFAAQAKIHTRNNVGPSGKIYFATKQGYPKKDEKRTDYPGGYPMVYDPKTGKTRVYPIPIKHQGIISITPDESRQVAYISTCSDERPIESTHFMILDLKTGKYRDLMDCRHMYAFIVVDYLGRAYHPILGGDIARYDPRTDKLERLKQTIDGKPPTKESHLADEHSHPINWDISPDGKTLYAVPMSTNQLYAYDLTAKGETLPGRSLGPLVAGAKATDCRAMCVGPKGQVWAALTAKTELGDSIHYLASYRPGDRAPHNHGPVAIRNPDFTTFTDKEGKPLPHHHGFRKLKDGTFTTKYVILGVTQGHDGSVYSLALSPYTLLKVPEEQLR